MPDDRQKKILEILRKTFTMPKWATSAEDSFRRLIVTIISQNTADRNTERAFENLSKKFKITPEALANAKQKEIEQCLRVGGLYRNKGKTIKQVSKTILEKYHGELDPILSMPTEQARKTLMQLKGVGPKTADVVLLFSGNKNVVPVDTHVNRVSKRLGLAPQKGNYEAVRKALQTIYNPTDYMQVHLLLIYHGRKYCKARLPQCPQCPINTLCPSRNLFTQQKTG